MTYEILAEQQNLGWVTFDSAVDAINWMQAIDTISKKPQTFSLDLNDSVTRGLKRKKVILKMLQHQDRVLREKLAGGHENE